MSKPHLVYLAQPDQYSLNGLCVKSIDFSALKSHFEVI